jgi:hypothetical protein
MASIPVLVTWQNHCYSASRIWICTDLDFPGPARARLRLASLKLKIGSSDKGKDLSSLQTYGLYPVLCRRRGKLRL